MYKPKKTKRKFIINIAVCQGVEIVVPKSQTIDISIPIPFQKHFLIHIYILESLKKKVSGSVHRP